MEHDEEHVTLGFEDFPWHMQANVLTSVFGKSEERAVNQFVSDLLSDQCIILVSRIGGRYATFGSLHTRSRICVTNLMTKASSLGIRAPDRGRR